MSYDPHAHLAAWLESGWEDNEHECHSITSSWGDYGIGHTLHLGSWRLELPQVCGFDSSWDAWAFCVATTGIDPLAGLPDSVKQWTKRPRTEKEPDMTPVQSQLF
jgi:hypothetical protein